MSLQRTRIRSERTLPFPADSISSSSGSTTPESLLDRAAICKTQRSKQWQSRRAISPKVSRPSSQRLHARSWDRRPMGTELEGSEVLGTLDGHNPKPSKRNRTICLFPREHANGESAQGCRERRRRPVPYLPIEATHRVDNARFLCLRPRKLRPVSKPEASPLTIGHSLPSWASNCEPLLGSCDYVVYDMVERSCRALVSRQLLLNNHNVHNYLPSSLPGCHPASIGPWKYISISTKLFISLPFWHVICRQYLPTGHLLGRHVSSSIRPRLKTWALILLGILPRVRIGLSVPEGSVRCKVPRLRRDCKDYPRRHGSPTHSSATGWCEQSLFYPTTSTTRISPTPFLPGARFHEFQVSDLGWQIYQDNRRQSS